MYSLSKKNSPKWNGFSDEKMPNGEKCILPPFNLKPFKERRDSSNERPTTDRKMKKAAKSGSKGKWKRLFLQEKFSLVSVIFFDHFIETRSRLYFPLIDWIEVIDSLKPDKTRESENL